MGIPRHDFDELFGEMLGLPRRDVSAQVRLPRLMTPELEALRSAVGSEDDDAVEVLVAGLLDQAVRTQPHPYDTIAGGKSLRAAAPVSPRRRELVDHLVQAQVPHRPPL